MILIAIGSNLSSVAGTPRETCDAALRLLPERGVSIRRTSNWYETAPVPISDQPWYVNGVAAVETSLPPDVLLRVLHDVEDEFARARSTLNAARTLDLDLLDYDGRILGAGPVLLPHRRMHDRAFVLYPLRDVAPEWRHPILGTTPAELIAKLPQDPENAGIRPLKASP